MSLELAIKERALAIGFDLAGIAPVSVYEDLAFSRAWVQRGYGGEMEYLANPKRDDPRLLLSSVKSVICVGLIYSAALPYSTEAEPVSQQGTATHGGDEVRGQEQRAWISRYAWGSDYHEIMRTKLEDLRTALEYLAPGVETRVYVDTGPVVERAFARYSGIGWTGKNTCLINEQKGSWFFLGVLLTSLDLDPDLPAPDRCGSCTRCIDACPTDALAKPYVMDASRCIAYFTIELKGSIPVEHRAAIGRNIFGCDICQDVCPWNGGGQRSSRDQRVWRDDEGHDPEITAAQLTTIQSSSPKNRRRTSATRIPEFQPLAITLSKRESQFSLFNPCLQDLTAVTESDFRALFRRSPIKRAKYRGWLRNLCVAIGNSGDASFVPWLERLCEEQDPMLQEHADWALRRLRSLDLA